MPQERGFETAQLRGRHWVLKRADGEEEHVRGDGVVGRFPLLREGGWRECEQAGRTLAAGLAQGEECEGTFIYQSMTGAGGMQAFGGELLMVPGSIRHPVGEEFALELAPFDLRIPEFHF